MEGSKIAEASVGKLEGSVICATSANTGEVKLEAKKELANASELTLARH